MATGRLSTLPRVTPLVRLLAALLALAAPVAAVAASTGEPVAPVLRSSLPKLKRGTRVPILLPSELPATLNRVRIYAFSDARPGSWAVTLSSRPRCGANACFVGSFMATRGGESLGGRPIALAQGVRGRYTPLSCGASCSPPIVEWVSKGALYSFQLEVEWQVQLSSAKEKSLMVELANSAILAGPR